MRQPLVILRPRSRPLRGRLPTKREQKDMAKHNGHLTKAEQRGINRQQNRISHSIYKDKHEAK